MSPNNKKRLQFDFTPQALDKLESLQDVTGATTKAEVVRKALSLLDFFVTNAQLAPDGHRVRWTLDGQTGEITSWVPHFIDNLAEGEHSLQLQLVGADGQPVAGPFNDTTRTFTVAASCPQ